MICIQCYLWSWCHYFWKSCFTLCPGLNPYADPSLKPTTPSPLRSPPWVFAGLWLDPLLKPYGRAAPSSWNSKLWQAWRENDNTSRSLEKWMKSDFWAQRLFWHFQFLSHLSRAYCDILVYIMTERDKKHQSIKCNIPSRTKAETLANALNLYVRTAFVKAVW